MFEETDEAYTLLAWSGRLVSWGPTPNTASRPKPLASPSPPSNGGIENGTKRKTTEQRGKGLKFL